MNQDCNYPICSVTSWQQRPNREEEPVLAKGMKYGFLFSVRAMARVPNSARIITLRSWATLFPPGYCLSWFFLLLETPLFSLGVSPNRESLRTVPSGRAKLKSFLLNSGDEMFS